MCDFLQKALTALLWRLIWGNSKSLIVNHEYVKNTTNMKVLTYSSFGGQKK